MLEKFRKSIKTMFWYSILANVVNSAFWLVVFQVPGAIQAFFAAFTIATAACVLSFLLFLVLVTSLNDANETVLKSSLCPRCKQIYAMYADDDL